MHRAPLLIAMSLFCGSAWAQKPDAGTGSSRALSAQQIMARVAQNQDRAEVERARFVYVQHAKVQSRKGKTVMCEEITDTRVAPLPHGQQKTLLSLSGQVREGDRVVHYNALPMSAKKTGAGTADSSTQDDEFNVKVGDRETVLDADANNAPVSVSDTDIDLVESMRRSFTSDKKSKDGVEAGLFPLTSAQQKDMLFDLKGREPKNGLDTFHIVFRPKDNANLTWKGEAWIDAAAFEPVVVRTALSRSLPFGVRALLGTNLPGLGFTVIYAPQPGDVWFPVSFGTEFKIRVLFFFNRQIVIAAENRSFERTHVTSTVHAEEAQPVPAPPQASDPQP